MKKYIKKFSIGLRNYKKTILCEMRRKRGFTLLELVVAIIIIAVLASLGFSQYTKLVESSRLTEARVNIGTMRTLATEYYYKYGSLTGIQNSDVGENFTCTSTNFYRYTICWNTSTWLNLCAIRCTSGSGGKPPDASRGYVFYMTYYPGTGQSDWHCYYSDDSSACFGYP